MDETWIKTNMAPLRGWAQRGQRLKGYAPHGHWRTMTFLAALRTDGIGAPCVFDGPLNTRCFQAWVEQELVPTLKPGDIVILDNLASHKSKAVRQAIRGTSSRARLSPVRVTATRAVSLTGAVLRRRTGPLSRRR